MPILENFSIINRDTMRISSTTQTVLEGLRQRRDVFPRTSEAFRFSAENVENIKNVLLGLEGSEVLHLRYPGFHLSILPVSSFLPVPPYDIRTEFEVRAKIDGKDFPPKGQADEQHDTFGPVLGRLGVPDMNGIHVILPQKPEGDTRNLIATLAKLSVDTPALGDYMRVIVGEMVFNNPTPVFQGELAGYISDMNYDIDTYHLSVGRSSE